MPLPETPHRSRRITSSMRRTLVADEMPNSSGMLMMPSPRSPRDRARQLRRASDQHGVVLSFHVDGIVRTRRWPRTMRSRAHHSADAAFAGEQDAEPEQIEQCTVHDGLSSAGRH